MTVAGAVRQAAGRRRAVAVATRTGTGGRCAIRVVRIAAGAGFATTLGRAGAGVALRSRTVAARRLRGRAVRVRVLLVGVTRRARRRIVHGVIARRRLRNNIRYCTQTRISFWVGAPSTIFPSYRFRWCTNSDTHKHTQIHTGTQVKNTIAYRDDHFGWWTNYKKTLETTTFQSSCWGIRTNICEQHVTNHDVCAGHALQCD